MRKISLISYMIIICIIFSACQSIGQLPSSDAAPRAAFDDNQPANRSDRGGANEATSAEPQSINLVPAFGGAEFERPVELGAYPNDQVFVAEQDGRIYVMQPDKAEKTLLADLSPQVSRSGNEEGLLSVALDPQFFQNQHLWVYYSVDEGPRRTRLARFTVQNNQIDLASELIILEQEQPYSNHNGGAIRFGPDMMLYLGFGDGGSGGDPQGNGQNLSTLLGSIIRIDVSQASPDEPYRIPEDNPFVEGDGRPEIWAYGLRNPWRMAFDPLNGQLWLGDVGQNTVEEVDIIQAGENYGWNILEGNRCFEPANNCNGSETIAPVAVYERKDGCSVSGGIVYRGAAIPEISNTYLYGDYCSGTVWAINAHQPSEPFVVAQDAGSISSFGLDDDNRVYILQFNGPILRIVSP